jgi:hypothetical protein
LEHESPPAGNPPGFSPRFHLGDALQEIELLRWSESGRRCGHGHCGQDSPMDRQCGQNLHWNARIMWTFLSICMFVSSTQSPRNLHTVTHRSHILIIKFALFHGFSPKNKATLTNFLSFQQNEFSLNLFHSSRYPVHLPVEGKSFSDAFRDLHHFHVQSSL